MKNYVRFNDKMILRDFLALDRTLLANERTLLAYMRTGIGLIATGVALTEFITAPYLIITGYIALGLSPIVIAVGLIKYFNIKKQLSQLNQEYETENNKDEVV